MDHSAEEAAGDRVSPSLGTGYGTGVGDSIGNGGEQAESPRESLTRGSSHDARERQRMDEEREGDFAFYAEQFNSILKPVMITMVIVVWIVNQLNEVNRQSRNSSYDAVLVYHEKKDDSGGSKFGGALLNALIFVAIILFVTVLFVILYKYRCLKAIYAWLMFSCLSLLGFFGGLVFWQILNVNELPLDWISFAFIVWNFAAGGIVSIFWRAPMLVQQTYLVAVSALLAVNLTNLPEWTTWMLLAAVAIYDLFAVLAPRGPLKVLVETAQERQEPIPGLIYSAKTFKLGLGDFIFYSVLVARGATVGDETTVAACCIAVLMGLCGTLGLLGIFKKALPALPFSIALGIVFYFLTRAVIVPYVEEFSTRQIYI